MYNRSIPVINTGSMADIAFLLLVFFLITTTLNEEMGIKATLPPSNPEMNSTPRADRNVLEILINGADELMIDGQKTATANIRQELRNFYTNPDKRNDLPDLKLITPGICEANLQKTLNANSLASSGRHVWKNRLETTELIGPYKELPHNAVISLQHDRSSSYAVYILVQNELMAGLGELRDECSLKYFGKPYADLDENSPGDRIKIKAIRTAYPRRLSEAEPVSIN